MLKQSILRDIAATQNFQIQGMRSVLEMKSFAQTADCVVEITRSTEMDDSPVSSPASPPANAPQGSSATSAWVPQLLTGIFSMISFSLSFILLC